MDLKLQLNDKFSVKKKKKKTFFFLDQNADFKFKILAKSSCSSRYSWQCFIPDHVHQPGPELYLLTCLQQVAVLLINTNFIHFCVHLQNPQQKFLHFTRRQFIVHPDPQNDREEL